MNPERSISPVVATIICTLTLFLGLIAGVALGKSSTRAPAYDFVPIMRTGGVARVDRTTGAVIFLGPDGKILGNYPNLEQFTDAELEQLAHPEHKP